MMRSSAAAAVFRMSPPEGAGVRVDAPEPWARLFSCHFVIRNVPLNDYMAIET